MDNFSEKKEMDKLNKMLTGLSSQLAVMEYTILQVKVGLSKIIAGGKR